MISENRTYWKLISFNMRRRPFWHMLPAKIQIRLRECAVWSESMLGEFWITNKTKFLHPDNKDSARMRRLIWIMSEGTFYDIVALMNYPYASLSTRYNARHTNFTSIKRYLYGLDIFSRFSSLLRSETIFVTFRFLPVHKTPSEKWSPLKGRDLLPIE